MQSCVGSVPARTSSETFALCSDLTSDGTKNKAFAQTAGWRLQNNKPTL